MRKTLAVVAGIVLLAVVNWTIYARERPLAEGEAVVLELAPVDPRSLMQGDYMALRFAVANEAFSPNALEQSEARNGHIVVAPDQDGVARFVRHDTGGPLAAGERRLRYRVRAGEVKFATNAWFFQEGRAADYENARYGEFRVAPSGEMLLVAMLGPELERLGSPPL